MRWFPLALLTVAALFTSHHAEAQYSCDPGYTICDDGCMPSGATCCHDGQTYCSSGTCCGDGTCAPSYSDCFGSSGSGGSGSGGSGGGSCPAGQVSCDGGCMPAGATCCHDGQTYCSSGVCCGDGTCSFSYDGCDGSGGSSGSGSGGSFNTGGSFSSGGSGAYSSGGSGAYSSGGSGAYGSGGSSYGGGSGSGNEVQCVRAEVGTGCDYVESCCDLSGCWYEADGATFECRSYDCSGAAQAVVSYCQPAAADDDDSGCTVSAGQPVSGSGLWVAAGAVLALFARRRRTRA